MMSYKEFEDMMLNGASVEWGNCEYIVSYRDIVMYKWVDNPNGTWYRASCSLRYLYDELSKYNREGLMSIYKSRRYRL